jgi:hypothetical protein
MACNTSKKSSGGFPKAGGSVGMAKRPAPSMRPGMGLLMDTDGGDEMAMMKKPAGKMTKRK